MGQVDVTSFDSVGREYLDVPDAPEPTPQVYVEYVGAPSNAANESRWVIGHGGERFGVIVILRSFVTNERLACGSLVSWGLKLGDTVSLHLGGQRHGTFRVVGIRRVEVDSGRDRIVGDVQDRSTPIRKIVRVDR